MCDILMDIRALWVCRLNDDEYKLVLEDGNSVVKTHRLTEEQLHHFLRAYIPQMSINHNAAYYSED